MRETRNAQINIFENYSDHQHGIPENSMDVNFTGSLAMDKEPFRTRELFTVQVPACGGSYSGLSERAIRSVPAFINEIRVCELPSEGQSTPKDSLELAILLYSYRPAQLDKRQS